MRINDDDSGGYNSKKYFIKKPRPRDIIFPLKSTSIAYE